jgi:hypothetical protein
MIPVTAVYSRWFSCCHPKYVKCALLLFVQSYRKVLAKLKLRKRDKSVGGQNASDDKADNRPAHFEQWRNERIR